MIIKPQLIILPGWEGSKKTWENFIKLARNDFEVYCFDLPCFGEELCPSQIWGVAEYAEFVSQKIEKLHLNKPILLGHSFGGAVAAYLAVNEPANFSKLILSGAAIFRRPNNFKQLAFNILAKTGKIIFSLPLLNQYSAFMKKGLYRLANSDYNNTSGIKREIYKKITRQDFGQDINKINFPTMVIWGEKDAYLPLKNGKKIAALIPNAKLEIIKNGNHGLHLKYLEPFYARIKKFIEQ